MELRAILTRLAYLTRLREATLERFGTGDPSDRLRASAVSSAVAAVIDREDSGYFRADLDQALRACGWRSVMLANRRHWKGMRAL